MYIPPERREAEIKRLSRCGVVDFAAVRASVDAMLLVSCRIEAVARIVANLNDEFADVGRYSWRMQRYEMVPVPPRRYHPLTEESVQVDLLAEPTQIDGDRLVSVDSGGHYDDGRKAVSRRIVFPLSYLWSEDWLAAARLQAKRKRLHDLEAQRSGLREAVMRARDKVIAAELQLAANMRESNALAIQGITSW